MSRIKGIGSKVNAQAAISPQSLQAGQGAGNAAMADQFSEALDKITQSPGAPSSSDGEESSFYLDSEMWAASADKAVRSIENLQQANKPNEVKHQAEQNPSSGGDDALNSAAKVQGKEQTQGEKNGDDEPTSREEGAEGEASDPTENTDANVAKESAESADAEPVTDPNIAVAASAMLNQKGETAELPVDETVQSVGVTEEQLAPQIPTGNSQGEKLEKELVDPKAVLNAGAKVLESEQQTVVKEAKVQTESSDNLSDQLLKSAALQESKSDREFSQAIKAVVQKVSSEQAKPESAPQQMIEQLSNAALLKQAMEVVRMARREQGVMEPVSKKAIEGPAQLGAVGTRMAKLDRQETRERAVRNTPRVAILNAMEKVETALKEAARGRDGKSISLRLDPPTLGTVQIDVRMKDGALVAKVSGDSAQVNLVLREKAHELQMSIRKLGLNLESVNIQIGSDTLPGGDTSGSSMGGNMQGGTRSDKREQPEHSFGNGGSSDWAAKDEQGTIKSGVQLDHWVA